MLPVGNRPLLQHTLEQFSQAGIRQVHITTHYLAEKIREHIGDGAAFGLSVQYRHETEPLGTAGALRHFDGGGVDPLLVINGDVLTTVNYRAMLEYHREHGAKLTVGVRQCSVAVPYGVVECDGSRVRQIREKPDLRFFCNAGIYLVEPSVCRSIPADRRTDMTDVIESMLAAGEPVVSFPIHEYWLDIGKLDDYERAQLEMGGGRLAG
jgi:NDP-sugar pyrophosphorylase family protein